MILGTVRAHKQIVIMVVFFCLLLFGPMILGRLENHIFLAAGIISAWLASEAKTRARRGLVIMAAPIIALVIVWRLLPPDQSFISRTTAGALFLVSTIVFLIYCGGIIVSYLLKARSVGPNQIAGAVSFYIILGTFWSYIYTMLEFLHPGSFNNVSGSEPDVGARFLYFSFVTLATLGYGDITPRIPFAQSLAVTEVIVGQFYMAIVVAYLLSIFIRKGLGSNPEDS